jgi:hypothetical protein
VLGSRKRGISMVEETNARSPVEIIPSIEGGISAIASAHAPFLYFENAPAVGHLNGIIRITLTASRILPGDSASEDHVIIAHLRMNVPAAESLKTAIESALLLAAPVSEKAN